MRFFIDMDGTLAKWNNVEFEQLFEEGYYRNLEPNEDILSDVNKLIEQGEDVYILSCVLPESKYALEEKKEWLKQYVPNLPEDKYIFVPYGENKADYLKEHYSPITNKDYLIDDYTKNLVEWKEYGGIGVKYLNGINHTKGTWNGLMIYEKPHGVDEIQDKSLYGLVLSEKLKEHNMNLIATALSSSMKYNNFYDYRACQVHFNGKSHYFKYSTDRTHKDLVKDVKQIVNITKQGTPDKHQIFNIENEPLTIDVSSNYYNRHYPTLSKCDDFDKLVNQLDSNTLDDLEYSIYLWADTDKIKLDENNSLQLSEEVDSSHVLEKGILWDEGFITTEDLLEDLGHIGIETEVNQDEPDITDDY